MPEIYLIDRPPIDEALLACARLLRTGLPPMLPSPDWLTIEEAAPADHLFLPVGTTIYLPDMKKKVVTPAIIIYDTGDEEQKMPNSRAYWTIKLRIDLQLKGDTDPMTVKGKLADLQRFFTETLPTGDPSTIAPWDRLNTASDAEALAAGTPERLHVFPEGIREVRSVPLATEHGHPVLSLTFSLFCGTRTELPPAV